MELPKEEIKIRKIGERTKEIDMRVAGRTQDKPAKLLAFMGKDNAWHFFGKDDKDLLFKKPAKDEYEIILNNEEIAVTKDVWEDFRHATAGLERTEE